MVLKSIKSKVSHYVNGLFNKWGPKIVNLVLILIKLWISAVVIFAISGFSSFFIRNRLIPSAVVKESIYFDFSATPLPIGSVNLLKPQRQWSYTALHEGDHQRITSARNKKISQYLTPDVSYDIELELRLPFTLRNVETGKFMIHCSVFDASGDVVAKSSRPVVIQYQSSSARGITSILLLPLRLLKLLRGSEGYETTVPIMSEYQELNSKFTPPTESFDFTLSTSVVDIEEVYLSVRPAMSMFISFLYHYPVVSWLIITSIVFGWLYGIFVGYVVLKAITAEGDDRVGMSSSSPIERDLSGNPGVSDAITVTASRGSDISPAGRIVDDVYNESSLHDFNDGGNNVDEEIKMDMLPSDEASEVTDELIIGESNVDIVVSDEIMSGLRYRTNRKPKLESVE